jgi:hypothetical protein
MERLISGMCLLLFSLSGFSQSVDFGIEVSQNYNSVEKFAIDDIYSPSNLAISVRDLSGDTSNVYFYKFTMDNHIELPLYFRYNLRKRWFFDFKLSNSVNRLQMWGVSNYTDNYFQQTYGSYDQFIADANASGFANADSSDYNDYMRNARDLNETDIRTVEEFKLLSFTANAGVRFFPHKSVKGFMAFGFTIKNKYQKHTYSHLDFSNDYIQNLSSIDNALDKYAERSVYTNFQLGLEFYRFRLTGFVQSGFAYTFKSQNLGSEIVYANKFTPFDIIRSFGFSMSANLVSLDVGKNVKRDLVSEDDMIVSNIKTKKEKWDIGLRFDRRGYNDLTTYFPNEENQLHVLKTDSILYNNWGTFVEGQSIQMLSLSEIKRVQWGSRVSAFMNIYLNKRIGLRASIGGSNLTYDVTTRELDATIIGNDSTGYNYLLAPGTPKLKASVYRRSMNLLDLNFSATLKVINRDIFYLGISGGFGFTGKTYLPYSKNGSPAGVNELQVYQDFDELYNGNRDANLKLYEGQIDIDLNGNPADVLSKFDQPYDGFLPGGNNGKRLVHPTLNFGFEAGYDRFLVGLGLELSSSYIDDFMLSSAKSAYFSVAYKIFRR